MTARTSKQKWIVLPDTIAASKDLHTKKMKVHPLKNMAKAV